MDAKEASQGEASDERHVVEYPACDFRQLLADKKTEYFGGTRLWVFDAVKDWVKSDARLFWLAGDAGTGKSVVTAKLFDMTEVPIVAWHFCRHDRAAESDPRVIIGSWFTMLCENLSGFRELVLGEQLEEVQGGRLDMFEGLIASPLRRMPDTTPPVVFVMDALDELPRDSLRPVLQLITDSFHQLPAFVKLFITSRNEAVIKKALSKFRPLSLQVDELRNLEDLRSYLCDVARRHVNMEFKLSDLEAQLERQFGLDAGTLSGQLSVLEEPIRKSVAIYDIAVQKIRVQPGYQEICSVRETKPQPHAQQPEDCLELLYQDASVARDRLLNLFASEWVDFKVIDNGRTLLRVPAPGKIAPWADKVIDPGLKARESAQRKIKEEYSGDARLLKDLARLTAECADCHRMQQLLEVFKSNASLQVVGLRNKFLNPTPLGYRDLNLSLQVRLSDSRVHICELQVNLEDMMTAKSQAHLHYETVRSALPAICNAAGIVDRVRFEASVMKLLNTPVLYSVLHALEVKAGGLFLYATLLDRQLRSNPEFMNLSKLQGLPSGLGAIYQVNFDRLVGSDMGEWKRFTRVIAMIVVARGPLSKAFVREVVGGDFDDLAERLSVLFPVRSSGFQVMHKTVVEWLRDPARAHETYCISQDDIALAHADLAQVFLRLVSRFEHNLRDRDTSFAFQHVVYHLCQAGRVLDANKLIFSFPWLLARAQVSDPELLLADVEAVASVIRDRPTKLLVSALRLSCGEIRQNWRYLPGQLVGRLIGYEQEDKTIQELLRNVRDWEGPEDGKGWWCPVQPTLEPACGPNLYSLVHTGAARSAQWSHDCRFLCSTSRNDVWIWHADSGKYFQTLTGHTAEVRTCCWSGDGQRLGSAADDQTLKVWDLESGLCCSTIVGHPKSIISMQWRSDGTICTGCEDGNVRIWNIDTSECTHIFDSHAYVYCVSCSDDDKVYVANRSNDIQVWDVSTSKCMQILTGHTGVVLAVAWARDGRVCSGGRDKTVRVWDGGSGRCLLVLNGHTDQVNSVAWSTDGRVCSGGVDITLRVWDSSSGQCIKMLPGHAQSVNFVSWNQQGKVCSSSFDSTARVWDLTNIGESRIATGHTQSVTSVSWSNNEKLFSSSADHTVRVWDAETGVSTLAYAGHSSQVRVVQWKAGKVLSAGDDRDIKIWDAESGETLHTLIGHTKAVNTACWGSEGQVISGSDDGSVRVWDVKSGTCTHSFAHGSSVYRVDWLCEGKITSAGYLTIKIWDLKTEEHMELTRNPDLTESLVLSLADDHRLIVRDDTSTMGVYDLQTGQSWEGRGFFHGGRPAWHANWFEDLRGVVPQFFCSTMRCLVCPTNPRRASARCIGNRTSLHPLHLLGNIKNMYSFPKLTLPDENQPQVSQTELPQRRSSDIDGRFLLVITRKKTGLANFFA